MVVCTVAFSACGSSSRTVVKGGIAVYEETQASSENPNPESVIYKEISNDSLVTTYLGGTVETRRADDLVGFAGDESSYLVSRDPNDGSKVLLVKRLKVSVNISGGVVPVHYDSQEEGVFSSGNWNDFISGKEVQIILTRKGQLQLKENSIRGAAVIGDALEGVLIEAAPELAHKISVETTGRHFEGTRTYSGTRHQLKVTQPSSEWSVKITATKFRSGPF